MSSALAGLAALSAVAAFLLRGSDQNLTFVLAVIAAGWLASLAGLLRDRRIGVLVAAAFGLGVSLYLGTHHVVSSGASVCSVNDTFNCDLVNQSKYAELKGTPIAFIGSAFYAGLIAVSGLSLLGRPGLQKAGHLVFGGALLSVGYSVFLAWASVQVGAWCLFCISMYGVNAILLYAGHGWATQSGVGLGQGIKDVLLGKDDRASTAFIVLFALVLVGARMWTSAQKHAPQGSDAAQEASGGEIDQQAELGKMIAPVRGQPTLDGTEPMLGSPSARYTVVEFADFECPHCGVIAPQLHELVSAQPDVKIYFKNYPLDQSCNVNIQRPFHQDSCRAAIAGECARQQGRFWELNRLMFMNQESLGADGLDFMIKQVGLDAAAMKACQDSPAARDAVVADVAHATALGLNSTPTLYVQGLYGTDWVRLRRGGPEILALLIKMVAEGKPLPTPNPDPALDEM